MSAPSRLIAPAAVNPFRRKTSPPTLSRSPTSAKPFALARFSFAASHSRLPGTSAPRSQIVPAAVNPFRRKTSPPTFRLPATRALPSASTPSNLAPPHPRLPVMCALPNATGPVNSERARSRSWVTVRVFAASPASTQPVRASTDAVA